jgi:hypothetical protein
MDGIVVKIVPNDKGNPPGKLADAELHFTSGPLDGLKLIGFGIWERRSFALLRPIVDAAAQDRIRDVLLEAYAAFEEKAPEARAS